jgi:hypothetical protein
MYYSYSQNARLPELFAQVAVWGRKQCHLGEVWRHDASRLLLNNGRARSCILAGFQTKFLLDLMK